MHLLPSWVIRVMKTVIAILVIAIFFTIPAVLLVALNSENEHKHKTAAKYQRQRSLREVLEGSGNCSRLDKTANLSVLKSCEEIRRDEYVYFRRHGKKVNSFRHKFVIDGSGVCDNHTDVIILFHSLHNYVNRRDAIRSTWGLAAKKKMWPNATISYNISMAFIFGLHANETWNKKIEMESKIWRDVIMGDFREAYNNMTLKSLMGLKWIKEFCPGAKFFIKSDDDMIINVPYLLTTLEETNLTYGVMGPYNKGSKVLRKGKWAVPQKSFPFFYYPPYESGSCYVISVDAVADLLKSSDYVPWIFIDDVYITGILGKVIGLNHVRREGFAYWTSHKPTTCDMLKNRIITGTKMTPDYTRELWLNMLTTRSC